MGKLVFKTAAITLASVIGAAALLFCAFVIFSPVTLARLSDNLNLYSSAVFFYEKQFQKTDSSSDLSVLISRIDEKSDTERLGKYSAIMLERTDFSDYCDTVGAEEYGSALQAEEYFYGKFAVSGSVADVVTFSVRFVDKNGYTSFNPFRILISERGTSLNGSERVAVLETLESVRLNLSDTSVIDADVIYLQNIS